MRIVTSRSARTSLLLLTCLIVFAPEAFGQQQSPTPLPASADDVVRVKTELIQTDVTVLDRHGRFAGGLKPEQFELRVDAKAQPLAFFEQVTTGSTEEEKLVTAARDGKAAALAKLETNADATPNRQLIFFFVDDLHLAGDSLTRARSVLIHFIENKMRANDRVAIVSTSGQIGFLQQLTDNKAVLREAVSRLHYKSNPETIASRVSISEVDANLVANRGERGLFAYLVEATMKEFQMQNPINAVNIVKNRVRQINAQSKLSELETLSRLETLIRSSAPLAGRKIVFFLSDGFVMDIKRSNGRDVMQRVANEAARVGAVVYTLDTRANFLGASVDASRNDYPDFSPRTAGRSLLESKAPQEPLETLADETGGRSYLNSNALDDGVSQALAESSSYYLLVWRPGTESQRAGRSRIDVTIKDRPDLRVRTRQHFFDFKLNQTAKPINPLTGTPEDQLRLALGSLYPRRDLPTSVSASLANTADKGIVLQVSMQLEAEMLSFDASAGKQQAVVDVLGVALDDRGLFSSFKQKLEIPRAAVAANGRLVKWNQSLQLPTGLYQVRVAVRDRQSGRAGSAMVWIEIPRLEPNPSRPQ